MSFSLCAWLLVCLCVVVGLLAWGWLHVLFINLRACLFARVFVCVFAWPFACACTGVCL